MTNWIRKLSNMWCLMGFPVFSKNLDFRYSFVALLDYDKLLIVASKSSLKLPVWTEIQFLQENSISIANVS